MADFVTAQIGDYYREKDDLKTFGSLYSVNLAADGDGEKYDLYLMCSCGVWRRSTALTDYRRTCEHCNDTWRRRESDAITVMWDLVKRIVKEVPGARFFCIYNNGLLVYDETDFPKLFGMYGLTDPLAQDPPPPAPPKDWLSFLEL